jgi:uncharacterized membrane protein
MGWVTFAAVFGVFFLTHSIPVRPAIRARLVAMLGPRGFTLAYSALSIGMLAWLIVAAGRAPFFYLWGQTFWQMHIVLAGMALICVILSLSIGRPNPFSFGGTHNDRFDPVHPGIVRLTRHPLLLAMALWSGLHLLPNGDLAHVILFGCFAGFALLGMRIIDRRKRRLMGQSLWQSQWDAVRAAPFLPSPASWRAACTRLGLGLGGFAVMIVLHPIVIGVSPLP